MGYNKKPLKAGEHQPITVVGQKLSIAEGTVVPAGAVVSESITAEAGETEE